MTAAPLLALALLGSAQDWIPLELPGLCVEREQGPWIPALHDGRHVLLERPDRERRASASAELSAAQLAQVIETEARRRGRGLSVFAATEPLLVQGTEEDAAWARSFVQTLDRAADRLAIELEVSLVPGADAEGRGDELPAADPGSGGGSWSARPRSGDELVFGERVHHRFVASFDVEVAHNSGVAAPVVGSVYTGSTVHVRAARVAGGTKVHLGGMLDLAEILRWEEFDPDTVDLGVVQEPVVASVQVVFSGTVESGGSLEVQVRGAPLPRPDWTLRVSARATADPAEVVEGEWRVADLAFLAAPPRSLGAFSLGTGLENLAALERLSGTGSAIAPSALQLRAESQFRASGRPAPNVSGVPTERTVMLPAEERGSWQALAGLARALEAPRLATAQVVLASGDLKLSFPVAAGEAARVLVGTERTWLVDYETQIAPDTWMPAPRVERAFDGIAWQGLYAGGALELAAAESRTLSAKVRTKAQANMGELQLLSRSVRYESGRRAAGSDQILFRASGAAPALALDFSPR